MKFAMGNAVEILKKEADHMLPDCDHNGVTEGAHPSPPDSIVYTTRSYSIDTLMLSYNSRIFNEIVAISSCFYSKSF